MSASDNQAPAKHPVDEVLPIPQMALYGLQHVLSIYAGVVAVPLIVGNALGLDGRDITYLVSAGLFISALATILQTVGIWKIGARQPIVQGTSFAAVSTILAIGTAQGGREGLVAVFGALIIAGFLALLIGPRIYLVASLLSRGRDRHSDHGHWGVVAPRGDSLGSRWRGIRGVRRAEEHPLPDPRRVHRTRAAAGPRWRRIGAVRDRCRQWHSHPEHSEVRRKRQPRHRRSGPSHGNHSDLGAGVLRRVPVLVHRDLRLRHHRSCDHRGATEHRVQHHWSNR